MPVLWMVGTLLSGFCSLLFRLPGSQKMERFMNRANARMQAGMQCIGCDVFVMFRSVFSCTVAYFSLPDVELVGVAAMRQF